MFPLQYKKRSYKPFDQTLDFLFLVDGTIEESYLSRIKKTPMHIVGLTSNITYAKYFDTVLLLESVGADLQYFFIEFALYSYLSGRRRKTLLKLSSRIGLLTFL